ncbi:hypothetical protein P152DRAFT_476794 [Eremomyces bilateralis CBS 781.70]|uniref:Ras GEF n=1 Tax=Eremomyces bilateralis CBS 781.70 TaxID=1392243 RepID=A0A6G1FTB1_9PEZI|nr:uncharacterized protein P152DRAFT_476794 [Eremomyces bilateralis CBS 781.70]KAF1809027.1 hypothetical protein P152DRAFT_476794 [Eremomyces bilateralis CBS 781.70]
MDRVGNGQDQDGFHQGMDAASAVATAGATSIDSGAAAVVDAGKPDVTKPIATTSSSIKSPRRNPSLKRTKNSAEDLRARRGGSSGNIAPDAVATARAGRNFTVGNVGNNGIIYLRPVIRPGAQRTRPAPPPFVFPPIPPPDEARDLRTRPSSDAGIEGLYTGFCTPLPGQTREEEPGHEDPQSIAQSSPFSGSHNRAHSFSTVDEHAQAQLQERGQSIKVVIHRPSLHRPKTADTGPLPVLEVPIPHYRLGTPQFNQDTTVLRSSVYTRASVIEDPRSSVFSRNGHERLFPSPPVMAYSSYISGRELEAPSITRQLSSRSRTSGRPSPLPPASERASKIVIVPELYDALTLNPDDPTSVRFAPSSGNIVAATPSRLIAHITSPSFLDYELLSDFFLTFRAFMASHDLIAHLIARMRWAVDRADDFGRIVRVRTFVAVRHWILNYFVDDFMPDYRLRSQFCMLTNGLYEYLRNRVSGGGGDQKIIGELKKCWRRTCSQYWDDGVAIGFDAPDNDIHAGPRDGTDGFTTKVEASQFVMSKQQNGNRPMQLTGILVNRSAGIGESEGVRSLKSLYHTPQHSLTSGVPWSAPTVEGVPISPSSERSIQALSCSIPMRPVYRVDHGGDIPLYPHPVQIPPGSATIGQAAPRASRPARTHKRSGSFSDALRDNRAPLATPKRSPEEAQAVAQALPGSLIRGAIFQPDSPYVEVRVGASIKSMRSYADVLLVDPTDPNSVKQPVATGPGMKKLLGTVRRALTSKHPPVPVTPRSGTHIEFSAPSTNKVSRAGTTASVSTTARTPSKKRARGRKQVRIDMLSARAGESFRKAITIQMELENTGLERGFRSRNLHAPRDSFQLQEPHAPEDHTRNRKTADAVTAGSRSIVIMDDTGGPEVPWMSGALPPSTLATESLVGSRRPSMPKRSTSLPKHATSGSRAMSIDQVIETGLDNTTSPGESPLLTKNSSGSRVVESRRPTGYPRNRLRKHRSASSSQLRYPSYHSGEADHRAPLSFATSGISEQQSQAQSQSSENDPFFLENTPMRPLRRRPGGDLRAVDNVHDLEPVTDRPRSAGSLSNLTHSVTNSFAVSPLEPGGLSLETELARQFIKEKSSVGTGSPDPSKLRRSISLVDTHSSQQNLRPSFEAEVAKLAALPDDASDDGGIESALLKLEGKYEKRASDMSQSDPSSTPVGKPSAWEPSPLGLDPSEEEERMRHRNEQVIDLDNQKPILQRLSSDPLPPETQGDSIYQVSYSSGHDLPSRVVPTVSVAARSEDSYSSVPLLERGLSGIVTRPPKSSPRIDPRKQNAPQDQSTITIDAVDLTPQQGSAASSMEHIEKTDSMRRIPKGETLPSSFQTRGSFLLDDHEALTDGSRSSGDLVGNSEDASQRVRSFFDDEPADDDEDGGNSMFTHPLRFPPTPPFSDDQSKRLALPVEPKDQRIVQVQSPHSPPTDLPPTTPTSRRKHPQPALRVPSAPSSRVPSIPPHLPFILTHDAEYLTQQFTIIEKDALDEIDWKELIELRWKQSSPSIRDWVDYLRTQTPRGVDVVIARFNIMVKWAVSELILTESLDERVHCIVQYIRIAAHARQIRNYATMYQITIALLSSDVSRMKRTWDAVPAADLEVLTELERLVQPVRNFHNLRMEMETAAVEKGCIPFIGIYTRDLVYNAQKPAFITSAPQNPAGEPLVNFERHHIAAAIVKSLLRLLEASSKYQFHPDPVVIGKCLWITALGDEEITAMSRLRE